MIGKSQLGKGSVDSRAIVDGGIAAVDLASGALSGASADLDSAGLVRMADGTLTPGVTIYNGSGSTLTKGTLVFVSSYTGTNGLVVTKADADAGLEATHVIPVDILNAASGIAVETVVLTGLNTNGQTIGDPVYLSATVGTFAFAAPTGADQVVQVVGTVKVVNASTGEISFFPGARRDTKIGTSQIQDQAVTLAKFGRSDAAGKFVIGQGASADPQYGTMSGDASMDGSGSVIVKKVAGIPYHTQATPTAKTVSATLTAAEILAGIITVNQAGGATSAQQLPTATDFETAVAAVQTVANDVAVDFHVINTSTVDAEDASVTTNTGWTLVGSMDIHAYSAAGSLNSSAHFRARRTAANTWTLYRIA